MGENAETSSRCMWVSRWCPGLGSGAGEGASRMQQTETGAPRRRGSDYCRAQLQSLRGLSACSGSHSPLDGLGTCRESTASREVPASCQAVPGPPRPVSPRPHGSLQGHRCPSSRRGRSRAVRLRVCPRSRGCERQRRDSHPRWLSLMPRLGPKAASRLVKREVNRGCLHCVLPGGFKNQEV